MEKKEVSREESALCAQRAIKATNVVPVRPYRSPSVLSIEEKLPKIFRVSDPTRQTQANPTNGDWRRRGALPGFSYTVDAVGMARIAPASVP
ncbi:MAG: hypothetical protein Q9207_005344 [Kuettlingeria erythrocarpa]